MPGQKTAHCPLLSTFGRRSYYSRSITTIVATPIVDLLLVKPLTSLITPDQAGIPEVHIGTLDLASAHTCIYSGFCSCIFNSPFSTYPCPVISASTRLASVSVKLIIIRDSFLNYLSQAAESLNSFLSLCTIL
jgi:hypothetical protein